jgi:hypothetical protein
MVSSRGHLTKSRKSDAGGASDHYLRAHANLLEFFYSAGMDFVTEALLVGFGGRLVDVRSENRPEASLTKTFCQPTGSAE